MLTHENASNSLSPHDYIVIVAEHVQLDKLLDDIRDACSNLNNPQDRMECSSERLASCKSRLPTFLLDAVDLAGRHFIREESIMLSGSGVTHKSECFRAHRKSHDQFLKQLKSVVVECSKLDMNDKTAEAYRHLYKNFSGMLEEHERSFDAPFIRSAKGVIGFSSTPEFPHIDHSTPDHCMTPDGHP